MKVNLEVQHIEKTVKYEDMVKLVKADLKREGYKISDLGELNLCYKIDDDAVYYVTSIGDKQISNIVCL